MPWLALDLAPRAEGSLQEVRPTRDGCSYTRKRSPKKIRRDEEKRANKRVSKVGVGRGKRDEAMSIGFAYLSHSLSLPHPHPPQPRSGWHRAVRTSSLPRSRSCPLASLQWRGQQTRARLRSKLDTRASPGRQCRGNEVGAYTPKWWRPNQSSADAPWRLHGLRTRGGAGEGRNG